MQCGYALTHPILQSMDINMLILYFIPPAAWIYSFSSYSLVCGYTVNMRKKVCV
jgi:hypothetical protein